MAGSRRRVSALQTPHACFLYCPALSRRDEPFLLWPDKQAGVRMATASPQPCQGLNKGCMLPGGMTCAAGLGLYITLMIAISSLRVGAA